MVKKQRVSEKDEKQSKSLPSTASKEASESITVPAEKTDSGDEAEATKKRTRAALESEDKDDSESDSPDADDENGKNDHEENGQDASSDAAEANDDDNESLDEESSNEDEVNDDASNEDGEDDSSDGMSDMFSDSGDDIPNKANDYPEVGSNPVLMIGGCDTLGSMNGASVISNSILRTHPLWWKDAGCKFMNFKYEGEAIVKAIKSKTYKHIVIADLSSDFGRFNREIGEPLVWFVKDFGGNIAFCTSSGDQMVGESLTKIFPEITWKSTSYITVTHEPFQKNKKNCDLVFGAGASDIKSFTNKAFMLVDVPENERYFATSEGEKPTTVAVKQFPLKIGDKSNGTGHGGRVGYFGDVDGVIVLRFLENEKNSADN